MQGFSNYYEAAVLDAILANYTNIYLALFTAGPNEDGTGTEVGTGSYARKEVASADLTRTGSTIANDNNIEFVKATASWGLIVGSGAFDASTSGNLLWGSYLLADGASWLYAVAVSDDTVYCPGHGLADDTPVVISALNEESLPGGLSEGNQLFLINGTTDTLQLSATSGGSAVNITSGGYLRLAESGAQTIAKGTIFRFDAGAYELSLV